MSEEILYEWKPALFFLNRKTLKIIAGFILLTVLFFILRKHDAGNFFVYPFLLLLIIMLIRFAYHLILFKALHFTLTNQRIIRNEGFFTHKTRDIELFRIKDVILTEPLILKFFHCGNILLVSTQIDSTLCNFFSVKDAAKVRELIRKTVFERREALGVMVRENE
jgi:uncharacterized membrane protein YdbT with pleckstrin-like domain